MKTLLIAEVGSVHDGSYGNACKLIELAASVGADAVKFQTHLADAESLPSAPSPNYFSAESRIDYFKRTGFTIDQWKLLSAHAKKTGILFLSSPFSIEAVDLLEIVGNSIYKIPSGEVTNIPLLEHISKLKKPILLSSGMSNWAELDVAVEILNRHKLLTILQCSSIYPCPPEKVGLNVIIEMKNRYGIPVGLSDHTLGYSAAISACALGATVIEKHMTFSRLMYGSDAPHSLEPNEFALLAKALRETWKMLDHPINKEDISEYTDMKRIFQKSLVSSKAIKKGTTLTEQHLVYKKPGDGIPAADYRKYLGRKLKRDIEPNTQLTISDIE